MSNNNDSLRCSLFVAWRRCGGVGLGSEKELGGWVVVRLGGCEEGAAWVWVLIWVRSESESGEVEVEVEVQGLEVDVVLLVTWSTILIGFLGLRR